MISSPTTNKPHSARECAYIALLRARRGEGFIAEFLEEWMRLAAPSPRDAALAREIAYGACRMSLTLDHLAKQCTAHGSLQVKAKERALLHTALYQFYFLGKIPLYALANESMEMARRHCHPTFVKFFNAWLRKLESTEFTLPQGDSFEDLSVRYSYPPFFIASTVQTYGLHQAVALWEAGNTPGTTMFRLRGQEAVAQLPQESFSYVEGTDQTMATLHDSRYMQRVANTSACYIQNAAPAELMKYLAQGASNPKDVLDMCSAPGGKTVLAHDIFPEAALFANDVSAEKIEKIGENAKKYGLKVAISCGSGENIPVSPTYDLIILDAPCSNTGVLNKRPEARWRLSEWHLKEMAALQEKLLSHAVKLLAEHGEIWYLTCSIMPEENELLIQRVCREQNLAVRCQKNLLPNSSGWDGGFASALRRKTK